VGGELFNPLHSVKCFNPLHAVAGEREEWLAQLERGHPWRTAEGRTGTVRRAWVDSSNRAWHEGDQPLPALALPSPVSHAARV